MIKIVAAMDDILLKPLDGDQFEIASRLYNCGSDIRYATGINGFVTTSVFSEKLGSLEANPNDFMTGIFIVDTKNKSTDGKSKTNCRLIFTGIASGVLQGKTLWIKLVIILPQFRSMGIGSRAMKVLFQHSKENYGVTEAFLSVVEKNVIGLDFWNNQSFAEVGRFYKILFEEEQPYEVIIMRKKL